MTRKSCAPFITLQLEKIPDPFYSQKRSTLITEQTFKNSEAPEEIQPLLSDKFELELRKKLQIRWSKYDKMNLYFREKIK